MTKEDLMAYQSKKAEIKELDRAMTGRWRDEGLIDNDVIFDYRKGYPMPQSVIGMDEKKYRRLQERDRRRKETLEQECEEVELWIESIDDSLTRRIFRMAFLEGKKQREIANEVHIERSTVSKKIDAYMQLSHKSHKSHL